MSSSSVTRRKSTTVPSEFIELFNRGDVAVDLSGWVLEDGVHYVFPPGTTLAAGGFLVLAQDPETLAEVYGVAALGPYIGNLSSDGERLVEKLRSPTSFDAPTFVGAVEISATGSADSFHAMLDGVVYGPFTKIRVRPCEAAGQKLALPVMTFFPSAV